MIRQRVSFPVNFNFVHTHAASFNLLREVGFHILKLNISLCFTIWTTHCRYAGPVIGIVHGEPMTMGVCQVLI